MDEGSAKVGQSARDILECKLGQALSRMEQLTWKIEMHAEKFVLPLPEGTAPDNSDEEYSEYFVRMGVLVERLNDKMAKAERVLETLEHI
jgi:GTP1/Obg family GTP-binding protein